MAGYADELFKAAGLYVQIPYVGYGNNVIGLPSANEGYLLRYYNPVPILLRHLNFYNHVAVTDGKARMALYGYDGKEKLLDTGILDCSTRGPLNDGNLPVTLNHPFAYYPTFYWILQVTNDTAVKSTLGLPPTAHNTPALNLCKYTAPISNLQIPASLDLQQLQILGFFPWAIAGQS